MRGRHLERCRLVEFCVQGHLLLTGRISLSWRRDAMLQEQALRIEHLSRVEHDLLQEPYRTVAQIQSDISDMDEHCLRTSPRGPEIG